jgi:hypothetical protein
MKKKKDFKTRLLRIVKIPQKKRTAGIRRQKDNYKYISYRRAKISQ